MCEAGRGGVCHRLAGLVRFSILLRITNGGGGEEGIADDTQLWELRPIGRECIRHSIIGFISRTVRWIDRSYQVIRISP